MNLPRVKELLAAWEAGALREAEAAELRGLLGEVAEAAEPVDFGVAAEEAECAYAREVGFADVRIAFTWGYVRGVERAGRGRSD